MRQDWFFRVSLLASVLALGVVILGAYVRLSDAGLGCPDWPGCYGHLDVPSASHEVERANLAYPDRPVEAHKAWKEMIHRYFAGTLGLLVFTLAVLAIRNRRRPNQQLGLPLFLVGLIIFQALLGMWTVTIKLNPTIVMSHLLGGLTTMSLLWWMSLRQGGLFRKQLAAAGPETAGLRKAVLAGLVLVVLQIMLGGWTSANYAALHCPDFPTCQGHWLPPLNFREAFTLWHGTEQNFEGGILGNDARVTIHFSHRLMALVVLLYLGGLALVMMGKRNYHAFRGFGAVLLVVLLAQVSLGISNVVFSLPLAVAVAHNAGAALLLLTVVTLYYVLRAGENHGYA
jgi:cytochrome c oxidase assembly protein subunit 15